LEVIDSLRLEGALNQLIHDDAMDSSRSAVLAFWSGCDDKPAAFVDRLDEAETYLNERLTACGEFWQLDAKTRKMLGLPPRSNSSKDGSGAAYR
jgi:hypothetical protein